MTSVIKRFGFVRTFRIVGPFDEQVVTIDTRDMDDEARRHHDMFMRAHLDGTPLNKTKDGGDGPAIRDVYVTELHSKRREFS